MTTLSGPGNCSKADIKHVSSGMRSRLAGVSVLWSTILAALRQSAIDTNVLTADPPCRITHQKCNDIGYFNGLANPAKGGQLSELLKLLRRFAFHK